jgi:hypothetical protein
MQKVSKKGKERKGKETPILVGVATLKHPTRAEIVSIRQAQTRQTKAKKNPKVFTPGFSLQN